MEIFAIRHGVTDDNKRDVLQGQRLNKGMNVEGMTQVQNGLRKLLESDTPPFSHIFSSPLLRTRQTAELIKEHFDLDIELRDGLLERDFGSLSGKTWKDIEQDFVGDLKALDKALMYDYQPYGGESAEQVRRRVLAFIDATRALSTSAVLVSTHGGTLRIFYDVLQLAQPDHIENGSVHTFSV